MKPKFDLTENEKDRIIKEILKNIFGSKFDKNNLIETELSISIKKAMNGA